MAQHDAEPVSDNQYIRAIQRNANHLPLFSLVACKDGVGVTRVWAGPAGLTISRRENPAFNCAESPM